MFVRQTWAYSFSDPGYYLRANTVYTKEVVDAIP
jgi:hypothetical protein